jgi:two-component system LytT family sensor kinase
VLDLPPRSRQTAELAAAMKLAARGALIWAAWTLYAFFTASQSYIGQTYASRNPGARIEFAPALRYAAFDCYLWAALTPIIFVVAGRLVVRRSNSWWTLPLLFAGGLAFGIAHLQLFVRLLPLIGYTVNFRTQQTIIVTKFHSDVLTAWTLFGIRHGIEYYRRYRVRELRASQLETKLAVAQLEVLKMQLQPHFLFNTLHAISTLMYRDVEAADRMITRLSDFVRLTIDSAGVQEVTLKREMECLDKYLDIEQVRFADRLEIRRAIDPATLDLLVPNLVLQPLAENAVRHGIAPRSSAGRIEIVARVEGGALIIEVLDDGPGTAAIREGVGLSNTRARLAHLYCTAARIDFGTAPNGGFGARLTLPAHTEPMHASPDRR